MRDGIVNLSATEMPAEVWHERVNPEAFDRLGVAMQGIELAAPLRVTEVLPVGGLVASAREAGLFDEGFEQDRSIRITSVPVLCQAAADQGKDAGGEITAIDPRQDEEAGVIDHEVQTAPALLAGPADRHVARFGLPGARAEAEGGDDVTSGTHEVAQLRSGQKLVAEIVMTFDVGVPEQRVVFSDDEFDIKSGQIYRWRDLRCKNGPFYVGMPAISNGFSFSRWWQSEQRIGLHFEQGHPTAHILQSPIGAPPVQAFADLLREPIATERRGHCEQVTNEVDLGGSKITCAIPHSSTRVKSAKGLFVGAQHFHVFVQALPTAPQYGEPRLPVALAPKVSAEAAQHAHRFTQRRGLCGARHGLLHAQMQRLNLLGAKHVARLRLGLHASQMGHVHQANPDDAEQRQVALQTIRRLELTVFDFAAGFKYFVPNLNTPATAVPLDLLDRAGKASDRQIREQHPTERFASFGSIALRRTDDVHSHRVGRAGGFRSTAPLWRLECHLRNAHLDACGARFAFAAAGYIHRQGADHRGIGDRIEDAGAAVAVLGYQQAIPAGSDQKERAERLGLGDKLEEVRFPIGNGDDFDTRRDALDRLSQPQQPLGALLLLD